MRKSYIFIAYMLVLVYNKDVRNIIKKTRLGKTIWFCLFSV